MTHRGEIVEEVVRQSGMALSEVARRMGKSRRHLYNLFEDPHLSIDVILHIGKIIHYDFTTNKDLFGNAGLLNQFKTGSSSMEVHASEQDFDAHYWKNKYLHLLERYNLLLEQNLKGK
jgi:hypothetical protein